MLCYLLHPDQNERLLQTTLRPHTSHQPEGWFVGAGPSSLEEGQGDARPTKETNRRLLNRPFDERGTDQYPNHRRVGFRLRGVQPFSRMVAPPAAPPRAVPNVPTYGSSRTVQVFP
ncbi:hypothetical protein TNCV_513871 [Trichonephila clavipes]|nr:hypothetical protein TNCV_2771051 [Trichonephila clavipes]GFT48961.1 hypothetical protein TNCV_513871 [Trichonephila clavipes]